MLEVLSHNILPVFSMLALGFVMGRLDWVAQDEARTINRIAFLVLQPPLIFLLITTLDMSQVRFDAIGIYGASEVVTFAISFALARAMRCATDEAFLLAMCVVFVNSLLYVGPISILIYGEEGAMPITTIVALDTIVSFSLFIIGIELIAGKTAVAGALPRIAKNSVLITIVVSLAVNLSGISIAEPLLNAARFAGAATAPMVLFALGVVLSAHRIAPTGVVATISALKLLVFPLIVWSGFQLFSPANDWSAMFLLNAAGPSGAMAFSLAFLHGVRTDRIAPVIIWTSVLSLLSLAYLA